MTPWWVWLVVGWAVGTLFGAWIVVAIGVGGVTRWEKPLRGKVHDMVEALPSGFAIAPFGALAALYAAFPALWWISAEALVPEARARRRLDTAILKQLHRCGLLANDLGGAFVTDALHVTFEQEILVPVTSAERAELGRELASSAWSVSGSQICWMVPLRRWTGPASVALGRVSSLPDNAGESAFWKVFPETELAEPRVVERLEDMGAHVEGIEELRRAAERQGGSSPGGRRALA